MPLLKLAGGLQMWLIDESPVTKVRIAEVHLTFRILCLIAYHNDSFKPLQPAGAWHPRDSVIKPHLTREAPAFAIHDRLPSHTRRRDLTVSLLHPQRAPEHS